MAIEWTYSDWHHWYKKSLKISSNFWLLKTKEIWEDGTPQ